ncbi:MAG: transporter [Planctomycetaceae bacterium]|nr:transporter [Planctomycetaceae bacterium]
MINAIQTRGLTKFYGNRAVVRSLDLAIPTGCVYGFLGRNGAGKSTTIKMLTGMVHPDQGIAEVLGENVETQSASLRTRVAFIAEGHPLYGGMTIDQLEHFSRPFFPRWNRELFDRIIDHFELLRKQKVRRFSNGQRAQVSLAIALAPDPELLILDDPTLGLDTVVRRDFLESMIQIIQREGRTILFSSHNLGDVERVADRIGVMVDGVLRVDCPTDRFKATVRLVIVEFAATPPPMIEMPGLVSGLTNRNRWELVIVGYGESHSELLGKLKPTAIDVVELNLEDAFIAYTRGRRRLFANDSAVAPEPVLN